jgi:Ca2+-binding RTX toxin-like protein
MTTLNLTQKFNEASTSDLLDISNFFSYADTLKSDISNLIFNDWFKGGVESGNKKTWTNPKYSGKLGEYSFSGSAQVTYDDEGQELSGSSTLTGATINTGRGFIAMKGSSKYMAYPNGNETEKLVITEISYKGSDGSSWKLSCNINYNYSYVLETDTETDKLTETYTSFSSVSSNGNSLAYSGSIKYDSNSESYSGFIKNISANIGGLAIKSSNQSLTVDDMKGLALNKNSLVAVSLNLNDKVYGTVGNDILDGGLGNDLLVGGQGNDTFSFSSLLGKKNIDTIADFTIGDHINLDPTIFNALSGVDDLGPYFKSLNTKTFSPFDYANAYVIYNKFDGKLYYDADGSGKGLAVQIAIIGNKADLSASDFVVA